MLVCLTDYRLLCLLISLGIEMGCLITAFPRFSVVYLFLLCPLFRGFRPSPPSCIYIFPFLIIYME